MKIDNSVSVFVCVCIGALVLLIFRVISFVFFLSVIFIIRVKREMACVLLLSEATDMRGFKFAQQTNVQ